jgi:nitrogen-specific signal transduction histidine kinase
MRTSPRKPAPGKPATQKHEAESAAVQESVTRLRKLAHDLGNSLEGILQATYLLKRCKTDAQAQRWVHLIDSSSQDAARVNRDMRKVLRTMCEEPPLEIKDPR